MGDKNQLWFIQTHIEEFGGPYLEIGSKDYGSTQNIRSLFSPEETYVGIDISEGKGVDVILDFTDDFDTIDKRLGGERFGSIFCFSVMEHCEQPFKMAENMTRLLSPNGRLCISVPFSWKFHGYPSDYWRFTPEGIKKLFPRLYFDSQKGIVSTARYKDFYPLDHDLGTISFGFKSNWEKGYYLRSITARALRLASKLGLYKWIAGYRYVLPPTLITMIGVLK
jgi:SAM-dependent methyltransferase